MERSGGSGGDGYAGEMGQLSFLQKSFHSAQILRIFLILLSLARISSHYKSVLPSHLKYCVLMKATEGT